MKRVRKGRRPNFFFLKKKKKNDESRKSEKMIRTLFFQETKVKRNEKWISSKNTGK